jgi:ABC-type arginine transport system permease subunit
VLALVSGASVSEVHRAGLESIHRSQTAAARALGLTYGQTMRHVVVPQAVRRVTLPLMNDMVALQKDTSLIDILGDLDVINKARFFNSSHATFTASAGAAILFAAISLRHVDDAAVHQRPRGDRRGPHRPRRPPDLGPWRDVDALRARDGIVFQSFNLFPT